MCDEYYDERMRAFWRKLAETEGLVVLPTESGEEELPTTKPLLAMDETPGKPKARALTR